MTVKKSIFILNAAWITALVAAIALFVNLISTEVSSRVDMTEENLFTLDPLSREIAGKFDDLVTVRYYATPGDFPPGAEFETLAADVTDKIEEYAALSDGRIRLEVIDPSEGKNRLEEKDRDRLADDGILMSHFTVYEGDKPIPVEYYSSIRMTYGDKTEVINGVDSLANLEYQVTRGLRRLLVRDVPKIGFYFTGEEKGFMRDGNYTAIPDVLRRDFVVETVDLKEKDPVPDDIDVLFVVATDPIPERHQFAIDQYLMQGRRIEVDDKDRTLDSDVEGAAEEQRLPGRVVFLLDTFEESAARQVNRRQYGQPALFNKVDGGITPLLNHYGVRPKQNLVLDLDKCAYGSIPKRVFVRGLGFIERPVRVRWPRIILTQNENYNPELAFVNRLDHVAFIDATSFRPADPLPAGLTYQPIIKSSKQAWELDFTNSPFIVGKQIESLHEEPESKLAKAIEEGRGGYPFHLGGVFSGQFSSFYKGKAVPPPVKKDDQEPGAKPPVDDNPPPIIEKTQSARVLVKDGKVIKEEKSDAESRVVVIGDTHAFSDYVFQQRHRPNMDFITNLLEWLVTEESLSRIKSKGAKPRPLDFESDNKTLYTIMLVTFVPFLVILCGIGVFIYRRIDKTLWLQTMQFGGPPAPSGQPGNADDATSADGQDS